MFTYYVFPTSNIEWDNPKERKWNIDNHTSCISSFFFFTSNSVLAILHYLYTFGNVTFCLGCVLTTKYNSEDSMNNSDSLGGLDGRYQFQTSLVSKGWRTLYRNDILKAKSMDTVFTMRFCDCVSVCSLVSNLHIPQQLSIADFWHFYTLFV